MPRPDQFEPLPDAVEALIEQALAITAGERRGYRPGPAQGCARGRRSAKEPLHGSD